MESTPLTQDEQVQVSEATKAVLIAAAVSLGLITLMLVLALLRCLATVASAFKTKAPTSGAKTKKENSAPAPAPEPHVNGAAGKHRGPDLKTLIKQAENAEKKKGATKDEAVHHDLFVNTLKGHGDVVHGIAWSADGQLLATACEDMMIRIFDVADVSAKDLKFRRIKCAKIPMGVGFGGSTDQVATVMRGAPDAIAAMYGPVVKKQGEPAVYEELWQVNNVHNKEVCMTMRAVPSSLSVGKTPLIFSCSAKKEIKVFNGRGAEIAVLEPNSLANFDLAVSLDGRFVAVASFTAEVKVWEVKFGRELDYRGASKVMELKGHKRKVACVAFSPDNKRAVTASEDATLRVWNIDVRYNVSEDPKTTLVISMPLPPGKTYQRLAFGPNGIIAASHEGLVHLISATDGDLLDSFHAHDSTIIAMHWSPVPRKPAPDAPAALPILATCSRDKRVRLWRSPR